MPIYKYIAMNSDKQKVKGKFIAADEKELASELAKNNLYLVSSTKSKEGTPSAFFTMGTGKVSMKDLTAFCRQLAIMLNAGITVLSALDNLRKQSYSSYFRSILQVVYEDVKAGQMLAAAIDKHEKVFPNFFRSMVHVGEASGRLETVFVSLADYYETDSAIKRKAKSALAYPIMLLCMTAAIAIIMLSFVIPTFKESMKEMDVEVEGFTKFIYDTSDFIVDYWGILLLAVFLVVMTVIIILRTEWGKRIADVLKVKLPLVGTITTDLVTARFARAFSILLSSGMDLSSALETVGLILGNRYLKKKFDTAAESVRHGSSMTSALTRYNIFPDMMIQMISVGEKTASLDEVLKRSCVYFDQKVETSLDSLTSKIQPIMLIIMGAVIGSLFIAVYSPMLSMMTGL